MSTGRGERDPSTVVLEARARYLCLPVRSGATKRRVTVTIGDVVRDAFDIELADGEPAWWAVLDLDGFRGETISVTLDGDGDGDDRGMAALDAVHQADRIPGEENVYHETRRPQLRFSPRRGWLNDPNGLVHLDGEYHLFFQHNPYGDGWGNMHWGHAVSRDLVRWEELPIALYPDDLGPPYSGSAVVDHHDTAGLRTSPEPALVAIYTSAGEPHTQSVAVSDDRGRTWRKHPRNPVLPVVTPKNRDPKVFWHAPGERWVMVLYLDRRGPDDVLGVNLTHDEYRRRNTFAVFTSPDLTTWEKASELSLPEDEECPELFELPLEGSPGASRWIFFGGTGRYLVGSFDGRAFTPESGPHHLHRGTSLYASQTFNDIPASDGRRILIAWMEQHHESPEGRHAAFTGRPSYQSMSLPVILTLRATDEGPRVFVTLPRSSGACGRRRRASPRERCGRDRILSTGSAASCGRSRPTSRSGTRHGSPSTFAAPR